MVKLWEAWRAFDPAIKAQQPTKQQLCVGCGKHWVPFARKLCPTCSNNKVKANVVTRTSEKQKLINEQRAVMMKDAPPVDVNTVWRNRNGQLLIVKKVHVSRDGWRADLETVDALTENAVVQNKPKKFSQVGLSFYDGFLTRVR